MAASFASRIIRSVSGGRSYWFWVAGILFALLGIYLISAHYVQNYSDPIGFLHFSLRWAQGEGVTDRAPLYPIILYFLTRLFGTDWVFISNIPFLLLMLALLGRVAYGLWPGSGRNNFPVDLAWLSAILAVFIAFMVRRELLLQLANPYREPLSFSLVLLCVVLLQAGWRRRNRLLYLVAGGVLGTAASIRETSLLLLLPIGLWLLGEMLADGRSRRQLPAFLLLGLILGLIPLLHRNYAYSGKALVPAYSARRVEVYAASGRWDIPVPGMRLEYFSRTAPDSLRRMWRDFAGIGLAGFLAGIVLALKRRNRVVLLLFLPAGLVYFIFYFFYIRYMTRYLLIGELFVVAITAYGISGCCGWLASKITRWWKKAGRELPRLTAAALLVWLAAVLVPSLFRDDGLLKVWHLSTLRSELLRQIEPPAVFMGQRHFCYRLSQLLDQDFYEYTYHFQHDPQTYASLEKRLRRQGSLTAERFASGNYYIDESPFALAANWLQRKPVFNFAELSVPFERYGRPAVGNLYRVTLWDRDRVMLEAPKPRPEAAVLMLDLKRPWDYPGRTFLDGREPGIDAEHNLTNGVQFVELPVYDTGEPFRFVIDSDRPLPPEPFWRLFSLNDEIRVSYGMGADHWSWNLASNELYPNQAIPFDSCQLYDRGSLLLPAFADEEHELFAEFRIEFIQEHSHWQSQPYYLEIEAGEWSGRWTLPSRRQLKTVVLPLGRGSGGFSIIPVELKTSLPSHETQNTFPFWDICARNGFVKLYDTRIFVWRPPSDYPLRIDIGSPADRATVAGGFFPRERSGRLTGRWTREKGEIRLKLPPTDSALTMTWNVLPIRPGQDGLTPTFQANGRLLPPATPRFVVEQGIWNYTVEVDPGYLEEDSWNIFSIETPTWRPADLMETDDTRQLGVFVTGLEVTAP